MLVSNMHKNIVTNTTKKLLRLGFTAVELVVVICVIGILASIMIIGYGNWQKSITIAQLKSDLNGVTAAMEDYRNFNNIYPTEVPSTFKPSGGTTLVGGGFNSGKAYCVSASRESQTFSISQHKILLAGVCPVLYIDSYQNSSYAGSGTTLTDISGYDDNGILSGGTSPDADGGGSLRFDGVDDWVSGIAQPAIKTGANEFTIIGVIKPDDQLAMFVTPSSNGGDQSIYYRSDTQRLVVNIVESQNLNRRQRSSPQGSVPINVWTFFAVSINDKNVKIYINGDLVSEYNETINIADWSGGWFLGQRGIGEPPYYYKGLIGMLSVYNHSLSDAEIKNSFDILSSRYGM